MALADLPPDATPDPQPGTLADLPPGAQPDAGSDLWRQAKMYGSAALQGAAQGVGGLMRSPTAILADAAAPLVPDAYRQPYDYWRAALDPGRLVDPALRSLGVADNPDLAPQSNAERYGAAAVRGIAAAAPSLVFGGGGGLLGKGLQTVAQGIGGGLGEQAASDLTQPAPGQDPTLMQRLAQQYGPMIGSVIGSLGAGAGYGGASKLAGAATGASTPLLDAYKDLNISPAMVGDVTGGPTARMLQATTKMAPGGVGPMHRAAESSVNQFGSAVEDTADMLGKARTQQQAGSALQSHGEDYLNQFRAGNKTNWDAVDMHIPASTPTPLTNYEKALQQVRTDMPNAPATAGVLEPSLTGDLLDALTADTRIPPRNTGLLNAQGQPIITPASTKPLTWQDAQGIRRQIGERLADPATYLDPGSAKLKQLYGALSSDQEALAGARGPAAADAFSKARDFTSAGHDFIDTTLSRISKGNAIDPEQAAANVMGSSGGGGSMLDRVRANIPGAADELAAWKLRDMALATAGKQDASGTRVSPGTFLTGASNLSPEATTALYGADPDVARRLANLRLVAGSMRDTEAFANTSKTAGAAQFMGAGAGILKGYETAGLPGALMYGAGIFGPGMVGSRLLTSPTVARIAANPGVGGRVPKALPAAVGALPYVPGLLRGGAM